MVSLVCVVGVVVEEVVKFLWCVCWVFPLFEVFYVFVDVFMYVFCPLCP